MKRRTSGPQKTEPFISKGSLLEQLEKNIDCLGGGFHSCVDNLACPSAAGHVFASVFFYFLISVKPIISTVLD